MSAAFVEAVPSNANISGGGTAVVVAGNALAIFDVDGKLFAIDDACLRCGASLAAGTLKDRHVTCGRCGWRYDLVTGVVQGVSRLHIDTYAVEVVNSRVRIATTARPSTDSSADDSPT